jgi:hypothetical protein
MQGYAEKLESHRHCGLLEFFLYGDYFSVTPLFATKILPCRSFGFHNFILCDPQTVGLRLSDRFHRFVNDELVIETIVVRIYDNRLAPLDPLERQDIYLDQDRCFLPPMKPEPPTWSSGQLIATTRTNYLSGG